MIDDADWKIGFILFCILKSVLTFVSFVHLLILHHILTIFQVEMEMALSMDWSNFVIIKQLNVSE